MLAEPKIFPCVYEAGNYHFMISQVEAEKLRESLQRARTELDDLDKNIGQIKEERDKLSSSQPKLK